MSEPPTSNVDILAGAAPLRKPSDEYLERLSLIDNAVRECIVVSRRYAGIASPTAKHFYASVLFTSLITRGVSLATLAPHSPWAHKLIEHWDYAAAAVVVRTMIELRATFHYLCVDPCAESEWKCRWNLLNLHDCVSRKRLFTAMNGESDPQLAGFEEQAEELRDRLRVNEHFVKLKHQKKLLNGQTPYLYPIEEMAEKAGLERRTFRWVHLFLSAHVHGLPTSFYRMGGNNEDRGRGVHSATEEGYTSLCLSASRNFARSDP